MKTTTYVPPEGAKKAGVVDDVQQPAAKAKGNGLAEAAQEPPKFRRIINPVGWEGLPVPPRGPNGARPTLQPRPTARERRRAPA